jgi:DNA-binding LytR/AlgR family response regulator
LYVEALGDYVKVHLKNKVYTTYTTMKNLEEKLKLNAAFLRVHRSYIININFLENIDNEAATIAGNVVPIGSKYKPQLQKRLNIL